MTSPGADEELGVAAKSDSRERILEVATNEFARHGFAGARIDVIAKQANCNKQLIYYYFNSKQGLYEAVLSQMVEQTTAWSNDHPRHLSEWPKVCSDRDDYHKMRMIWHRMVGWEALQGDLDHIHIEDARRAQYGRVIRLVEEAQASGDIDASIDPSLMALVVMSFSMMPTVLPQVTKMTTGLDPDDERFLKGYEDLVRRILEGCAPPKADRSAGDDLEAKR